MSGSKILYGVSIGFVVLARVVEMVGGDNNAFVRVDIKGSAIGECIIWGVFIVCIGDFCGVSTVVIGVTFLLFGGDCDDGFSTGSTGVGVLCTILMVCCSGWPKRDGFSTIVIGVIEW